jgi:hypothetical protein
LAVADHLPDVDTFGIQIFQVGNIHLLEDMIDRGIQFVVVKKALGGGGGDGKTRWEAHPGKGSDLAEIGHFFSR